MKWTRAFFLALLVIAPLFWAGCNDNNDGGDKNNFNLTGSWVLSFDNGYRITMTFDQDGDQVQGVGQDAGFSPWSFSGKLDGDKLTGKFLPPADVNAIVDADVIAGTYDTAVDRDHSLAPAEVGAQLADEIVERGAMLGEHDQLAARAG